MDENNGLQLSKNAKKKKSRELLKEMRERDSKAAAALAAEQELVQNPEQKLMQEAEPAPENIENAAAVPEQSGFSMESVAAVSAAGAAAKSQSDYMEEFREIKQQLAAEAPKQAAMPSLASAAKPLDDDIRNSKEYQDFKAGRSGKSSAPKQSKPLPPSIAAAAKEAQEKHLLSDSAKQMIIVFAVIAFIFIGLCLFSLVGDDQQIPTASPSDSSKVTTTTTTASGAAVAPETDSSDESIVTTTAGQSDISVTTTVKQDDSVTSKEDTTSDKTTTTAKQTTTTVKKTTTTAKQTTTTVKKTTTTAKKTTTTVKKTTTAKQTTTTPKKTTTTAKKTTTTAKKTTTTAKKTTTTKAAAKTGLTLDKNVNAWGSGSDYGATVGLSIVNNTSGNIENWKITMTVPSGTKVNNSWGCKYTLNGTTLTLIPDESSAGYNLIVPAGGSISLGANLASASEMTADSLKISVTY